MTRNSRPAREPKRTLSTLTKVTMLAVVPLLAAGCRKDPTGPEVAGWSLVEPTQRHPIMVSQQPANLNIHVGRGSDGLSPSQRGDVMEFVHRYRAGDSGNSRLVISVPSGSPNEVSAMNAVEDIRDLLTDGGFNESAIAIEAYSDEQNSQPPVRLSYLRHVAQGPECGLNWSENLASDYKNTAHPDFGCSQQRNLAAQIANPADLLGPRSMERRYGQRRDIVMDAWAKGKVTGAEKSEDERIQVAQ